MATSQKPDTREQGRLNLNHSLHQAFDTHREALSGFIRKRVDDPATADDLLQDLYIKLQSLNDREVQYPKAYLYRMANNLVVDEKRKQARFVERDSSDTEANIKDVPHEERSPEAILSQSQRLSIVTEALQELPEKTRDAFYLLRLKQLDKQDVAKQLGISANMVEKHVRKALEYCQLKIKKLE